MSLPRQYLRFLYTIHLWYKFLIANFIKSIEEIEHNEENCANIKRVNPINTIQGCKSILYIRLGIAVIILFHMSGCILR
jgi:hypothetical protein